MLQKHFFRARLHYFATLDRITWILMLAFLLKLGSIIARCLLGTWDPFVIIFRKYELRLGMYGRRHDDEVLAGKYARTKIMEGC